MENKQLKNKIFEVLKADVRLWDEKKTELNQTLLLDLVENIDENVIELLLGEESLREKFFAKIKDIYVFKTNDFKFFMEENKVNNSYTQYKNRIGLTDGKRFLKDSGDVVLDFPYKDCVLEGGQSNEEGLDTYFAYEEEKIKTVKGEKVTEPSGYQEKQSKRKEVFFNQVLAQDEIDRLFDEKALVNWSRFTQNGKVNVEDIKRDEEGIIKENLIIKGNNLLALHSLKSQFKGQVKLIYIDPPYNTGSDGFKYNDNFNHSTWLTFMKNRLEVARELLREDGVIFVQCDDNELSYLKILMDDIFKSAPSGKTNFIQYIEIKANVGAANEFQNPFMPKNCEYGLYYAKNYDIRKYKQLWAERKYDEAYSKIILNPNEEFNKWQIGSVKAEIEKAYNSKYKNISKADINKFVIENSNIIFQAIGVKGAGKGLQEAMTNSQEDTWAVYRREPKDDILCYKGRMVRFYSKNIIELDGKKIIVKELGSLWDDILWNGIANEGGVKLKNGKKPERLLRRIIEMSTEENDIVLDYHLGSGTTCAVAHKMGRQYIGIEQIDYGDNDSVTRLQNVVNGDKTGISEAVKWKGGGDFIYLELAKWNEQAKEEINTCESLDDLAKLFDTLYEKYFLNYNFKVKEFKEKVINEDEFKALSLEEQKRMFLSMLDLNQMYVQKTEMEDKRFDINEEDQKLTSKFYNE